MARYSRVVLLDFVHALALALLAAFAVDLGFGAAFVDDLVGVSATIYAGILVALLVGSRGRARFGELLWLRIPVAAIVALLVAQSLRTWALLELPVGQFTTTGHSPYAAFPICAVVVVGVQLLLLRLLLRPSRPSPQAAVPNADDASPGSPS